MIPAFNAAVSSSRVLPTPENTTFFAALRSAMSTRSSSPPETTSNPHPFLANRRRMLRFELALTE